MTLMLDFAKLIAKPNTLVLTPNQRLAAFLRQNFDRWRVAQGEICWQSVDILPINSWVHRCWEAAVDKGMVEPSVILTPFQASYVWQRIIAESQEGHELWQIAATAKIAMEAWELIQKWQLPRERELYSYHQDCLAFFNWSEEFIRYCEQHHVMDSQLLLDAVVELARQGKSPLTPLFQRGGEKEATLFQRGEQKTEERVFLVGFDTLAPQIQALLNALTEAGCSCEHYDFSKASSPLKIGLSDNEQELLLMARWAKEQLHENPDEHIGCVIPELNNNYAEVERVFTKIFMPEEFLSHQHSKTAPFNISIGEALAETPLISSALLILTSINKESIELETLGILLRSPFLGAGEVEFTKRAQLDAKLRALGASNLSMKLVMQLAQDSCPELFLLFNKLIMQAQSPQKLLPSAWMKCFASELASLGWPGERESNSVEYQQIMRWQELLLEFTSLDYVSGLIMRDEAISLLKELAQNTIFHSQSEHASIQVLGLLEAAGLTFNKLWVMGVHDGIWPGQAKPNPFIPMPIQRKGNIPHASAERELNFYQTLTRRFCGAADTVIFSYPQFEHDQQLRPSPLLSLIPEINVSQLNLPHFPMLEAIIANTAQLEFFEDNYAPPIPAEQKIKCGTQLFKHQAACPFRSMAIVRLGARALTEATSGLSPVERGSLLHKALENIWQVIGTHEQLCNHSPQELQAIIQQGITKACTHVFTKNSKKFGEKFLQIEQSRLSKLIEKWLEIERARPPFITSMLETKQVAMLGEIEVHMQIDRIDQLQNGDKFILDYKTGNISIRDLLGQRPNEPQLLLYCVTHPDAIEAIAFAQINAQKITLCGIGQDDFAVKGIHHFTEINQEEVPLSWTAQINQWREILVKLAQEFRSGYAAVDPKEGTQTCQHCDLHSFCRVYETGTKGIQNL